jgi:hypothetical protein
MITNRNLLFVMCILSASAMDRLKDTESTQEQATADSLLDDVNIQLSASDAGAPDTTCEDNANCMLGKIASKGFF